MYVSQQNMLEFTERSCNVVDLFVQFKQQHNKDVLNHWTLSFMKLAFQHGAYCAGGFATLTLKHLTLGTIGDPTKTSMDFAYDVGTHMNTSRRVNRSDDSKFSCTRKGDIDLFFPSQQSIKEFYANNEVFDLLNKHSWGRMSSMGLAREHFFDDGLEKVQVITRYAAPIKTQLSSFDIYNAAVAFNDTHVIVPQGWEDLERMHMLHVNKWNQYTVSRVAKYMDRKGYTKLSPATASEIYEKACEALNEFASMPDYNAVNLSTLSTSSKVRAFGSMSPRKLAYRLMPWLPSFTNEQLLTLSVLCPQGNYNEAFKALINRGDL